MAKALNIEVGPCPVYFFYCKYLYNYLKSYLAQEGPIQCIDNIGFNLAAALSVVDTRCQCDGIFDLLPPPF